jgi:serine/threonine-protein kinase
MAQGPSTNCERCQVPQSSHPCRRCPIRRIDSRIPDIEPSEGLRKTAVYLADGRIRLEREIGRGSMGTVFSAVDESLERVVAVKLLRPELQANPEHVEWFRRETRAAAAIVHKNVVTIYSSGRHSGTDYFVAEYIDGPSLERLLQVAAARGESFPVACALWVLDQVCAGLAAVHAAGVVHRDVKPANVLIEAGTGRVVITDFGVGAPVSSRSDASREGSLQGSIPHRAPEALGVWLLDGQAGRLADVYALGVTAYQTLAGELPYPLGAFRDERTRRLEPPRPPSAHRSELPRELDAAVLRCLAEDPAERFQSIDEVREALKACARSARRSLVPDAAPDLEDRSGPLGQLAVDAEERLQVVVADPGTRFISIVQEAVRMIDPQGTVTASRSPSKALALARSLSPPPRVIVAPLRHSHVNGVELLDLVEQDPVLGGMSRVMLVAEQVGADERAFLERKGVAAILKPQARPIDVARALYRVVPSGAGAGTTSRR